MATSHGYILGRTAEEYARLRVQARVWEDATAAALAAAGIALGMRCLDAGCGAGDGMRLMGRSVGPDGRVTGIDLDAGLGAHMLAELRREEGPQFDFVAADLLGDAPVPGAPFDFVLARLLLIHQVDPVAAVRRLGGLVRPGGRLLLMDFDLSRLAVRPEDRQIERGFAIVAGTFAASGKHADCGLRLGSYLLDAGLPFPDGTRADASHVPIAERGPMLRAVLASLAPAAAALGVATAEEIAALQTHIAAAEAANRHFALGPMMHSAWTTLP
jgi:SAM-dependent methyltransferase